MFQILFWKWEKTALKNVFIFLWILVSPEKMKEIQAQIEAEKRELAAKKNMEESMRNKLARNLEKRERELRRAQ